MNADLGTGEIIVTLRATLARQKERIEVLEKALRWYADSGEPRQFKICKWDGEFLSDMASWGERARAALKGEG